LPTILFICTANQFRSPIAAACFTRQLALMKTPGDWKVISAGTWAAEGLPAHPKAVEAARGIGLDITNHRTREVNAELLDSADLIVCMQSGHREALEAEFPSTRGRILMLATLAGLSGSDIEDPARRGFDHPDEAARLVCQSVENAFSKLIDLAEARQP
jgi:protein-tyrosine phosphatase